jgi:hypothetical protein
MDRLEPCPTCQRHVRVSETSCPFCGANVEALGALPARALPSTRLGRAALFAFGVTAAATAAGTAGCVEEPDPGLDEDDDGAEGEGSNDAGTASTSDAGASAGGGGGVRDAGGSISLDAGTVVALYGLAVPGGGGQPGGAFVPDAARPFDPPVRDAGRSKDSGPGGDLGGAVALYGLAPAPDAGRDVARDAGIIRRDAGGIVALYGAVPAADIEGG